MAAEAVDLADKLAQVTQYFQPHNIASYNGNDVRVSKLAGEFVWHSHTHSDELFFVLKGSMKMHFRDRSETLSEGELIVVPSGVEHKPEGLGEVHLLVLDKEGESPTGSRRAA